MSIDFLKKIKIYFFIKIYKLPSIKNKEKFMQEIIQKYHIKAKKSLGQNFLMDETILKDIVQITSVQAENIIEVWPGFWALTTKILSENPKSLTLVELDTTMISILQDRIASWDIDIKGIPFEIIHQDILKYIPEYIDYKVIANIPYYITSPILQHFLYGLENKPSHMIILMQKEVWDRIISKKSSVLSLFVQKKCTVTGKIQVPASSFSPPPKVDSSVLFFERHEFYNEVRDDIFLAFIKAAFSNPRKKMINNLAQFWYSKQQILKKLSEWWYNENTRAEELSVENYIELIKSI